MSEKEELEADDVVVVVEEAMPLNVLCLGRLLQPNL